MKKSIIILLTCGFFLTSCNNNDLSSNSVITVSSFSEALDNTKYYALKYTESNNYTEIYLKNFYYNTFSMSGDIIVESDQSYVHDLRGEFLDLDNSFDIKINVYGRTKDVNEMKKHEETNLIGVLKSYSSSFTKQDDNTYYSSDLDLCYALANFYESKLYKFSNYVEIKINDKGRLSSLQLIEKTNDYSDVLCDAKILLPDYNDIYFYKDWVERGKPVNDRIRDIKNIDEMGLSLYEYENVKVEGYVSAKDAYGNIYLTSDEDGNNRIGIELQNCNSNAQIGDKVLVEGLVETTTNVPHLKDVSLTKLGKNIDLIPAISEETAIDSYGGGVYAAQIFTNSPIYSDSIYTTYAYVDSIPEQLSGSDDTIIELVCPSFVSTSKFYFTMDLIIPFSLDIKVKESVFNKLKESGIYHENNAVQLCFENIILKYNTNYKYNVGLLLTSNTLVYERLNALDKIKEYTGLEFPSFDYTKSMYYRFGKITDTYLESEYGQSTDNSISGLYVAIVDFSNEDLNNLYDTLENLEVKKYDEIKDNSTLRHVIYNKNDLVIDFCYMTSDMTGYYPVLNIWTYKGEVVHSKFVKDILNDRIGSWFNVNNFLKLTNTYEADYTVFTLNEYASVAFDESPLTCVTIDLDRNIDEEYKIALIKELGYSQYKLDNGKPYTYRAKGKIHYVFSKDGTYVDVASYPTSDYTYTGHKKFEYRLEVLIYKRNKPIEVPTYQDLSYLSDVMKRTDNTLAFEISLPTEATVEVWHNLDDYSNFMFGYGTRDEAFIYSSNVSEAFESIDSGLKNSGYEVTNEFPRSTMYRKAVDNVAYNILVLKEETKGYVRMMLGMGGLDFYS